MKDLSEKDRENFKGAIILDQVGFQKEKSAAASVIFETKGNEDPKQTIVDTMALSAKASVPRAEFKVNYHGWGSDHMPFLEAGLPAVLLIERDNLYSAEHFGHTPKDTLENVDYDFGAKVARHLRGRRVSGTVLCLAHQSLHKSRGEIRWVKLKERWWTLWGGRKKHVESVVDFSSLSARAVLLSPRGKLCSEFKRTIWRAHLNLVFDGSTVIF